MHGVALSHTERNHPDLLWRRLGLLAHHARKERAQEYLSELELNYTSARPTLIESRPADSDPPQSLAALISTVNKCSTLAITTQLPNVTEHGIRPDCDFLP